MALSASHDDPVPMSVDSVAMSLSTSSLADSLMSAPNPTCESLTRVPFANVHVRGLTQLLKPCCLYFRGAEDVHASQVLQVLSVRSGLPPSAILLLQDGRIACDEDTDAIVARPGAGDTCAVVEARLRRALPGGKGGFGAMLRGAGAGNTRGHAGPASRRRRKANVSACRDLSGRRIRDVEAEKEAMETADFAHDSAGSENTAPAPDPTSNLLTDSAEGAAHADADSAAGEHDIAPDVQKHMEVVADSVADAVAEGLRAARRARKAEKLRKRKQRATQDVDAPPAQRLRAN